MRAAETGWRSGTASGGAVCVLLAAGVRLRAGSGCREVLAAWRPAGAGLAGADPAVEGILKGARILRPRGSRGSGFRLGEAGPA